MSLLAAGVVLARDYGPSWDEGNTVPFGKEMLSAYTQMRRPTEWTGIITFYGPAYLAFTEAIVGVGRHLAVGWRSVELRHFVYFLSLPVAAASLYDLATRWVSRIAALTGALLFVTQPLFWGHAFINPKDMPFLALFALSMALGMNVVEALDWRGIWSIKPGTEGKAPWSEFGKAVVNQLRAAQWKTRALGFGLFVFGSLLAAELLVAQRYLLPSLLALVKQAYSQQAWPPINDLFSRMAERASVLPFDLYSAKVSRLYFMLSRPIAALGLFPALLVFVNLVRPSLKLLRPNGLPRSILLAGTVLGLATSTRVLAPFCGLIVSALMLARAKRGSWLPLAAYWAIAGFVTYLTWPYLWGDPLGRLRESYQGLLNLETNTPVLFYGQVYPGSALPWYFAPMILALQLTEPFLVMAAIGIGLALREPAPRRIAWASMISILTWTAFPLGLAMASVSAHYDNARQYFFALPPLFLLAALTSDSIFKRIRGRVARLVLVTVILLPGVVSIIRLHPYQYIYYNSLVGGTSGANRRFETDYWATSYRKGVEVLNEVAPLNSSVFILGPWEGVAEFLRPDIAIYDPPDDSFDRAQANYLLITTRANMDIGFRDWASVVGEVQIDGAVLAYLLRTPAEN